MNQTKPQGTATRLTGDFPEGFQELSQGQRSPVDERVIPFRETRRLALDLFQGDRIELVLGLLGRG